MSFYRKVFEVVGYASNGAAYCVDCALGKAAEDNPIMLDDCDDLTCDECGDRLDGEEHANDDEDEAE